MKKRNPVEAVDRPSKFAAACFLRHLGYNNIDIIPEEDSIIDIKADSPEGLPVAIEVKHRHCKHDTYPDMRCEHLKYRVVNAGTSIGLYSAGILVSIYDDGYIAFGNLLAGRRSTGHGPKSTTWDPVDVEKDYWDVDREKEWYIKPLLDAVAVRFAEEGK